MSLKPYTPRMIRVLRRAREIAGEFRHGYLCTEHVLLAIVDERERQGVSAQVLLNMRAEAFGAIDRALRTRIGFGPQEVKYGELPHTPTLLIVLALSIRALEYFGHQFVGTEHVTAGMIYHPNNLGGNVLRELGYKDNEFLAAIRQFYLSPTRSTGVCDGSVSQ